MYRQDRKTVQRIKARDIVPGDIVEVAGRLPCASPCVWSNIHDLVACAFFCVFYNCGLHSLA